MSKLQIYSSSAGSGKTYTLTQAYLTLLLKQDQPYYFRQILAITFTNDAANEMKERILQTLEAFSAPDFSEQSAEWGMYKYICEQTKIDPTTDQTIRERAKKAFEAILHDYSDFGVKTIDSFINQIARSFTEDLQLPYNYETELNSETILELSVERLFKLVQSNTSNLISEVLKEYALETVENNKSMTQLGPELAKFGGQSLNDQHYAAISRLDNLELKDFYILRKQLTAYLKTAYEKIQSLGSQALTLMESVDVHVEDFSYGRKGGAGILFEKFKEDPENIIGNKLTSYQKNAIYEDKWYSNQSIRANQIDQIKDELIRIYKEFEELRPKTLLYQLIHKDLLKLGFLRKIKEEFDNITTENNQVFISEFNRRILSIVLTEPVPFLYERIGEKYNHLLIDEFQDTSDIQFFNLLPLLENSLGNHHLNLIVGDAKQAIYRWRGGKMESRVHLSNRNIAGLIENPLISNYQIEQYLSISEKIQKENLAVNYRSAKEIIDFNNAFFGHVINSFKEELPFLSDVYSDYHQEYRKGVPSGGHIELKLVVDGEDQEQTKGEEMKKQVLEVIEKVKSEGYSLKDIAILTRNNKDGAAIAEYLNQHNLPIITNESLLLWLAWEVKIIISLLKVIQEPSNILAKFEAIHLFALHTQASPPSIEWHVKVKDKLNDTESYTQLWAELGISLTLQRTEANLFLLTEKLVRELGFLGSLGRKEYIFALTDIVLKYSTNEGNQLDDFLTFWGKKQHKFSLQTAADVDAITITSIHKSKGLAFPVVIIPHANWSFTPKTNSDIWVDLSQLEGLDELVLRKEGEEQKQLYVARLNYNEKLQLTPVKSQYESERKATFLENLNMLYVAFTRPKDRLYILTKVTVNSKNNEAKFYGIGTFFESYLTQIGQKSVPPNSSYIVSQGTPKETKESRQEERNSHIIETIQSKDTKNKLRLKRSSERFFDIDTLEKSKDKGNKIHGILADIYFQDDTSQALEKAVRNGLILPYEVNEFKQDIVNIMQHPLLQPLFQSPARVQNEREILLPSGEMLRPDRVVHLQDTVYIIDYKTGTPSEKHKNQVRKYAQIYAEMGYTQICIYLVYISERNVIQVY
ncbi:MAG: UvrD-helicase domain-containing protein [Spirosomataceae bacterium]